MVHTVDRCGVCHARKRITQIDFYQEPPAELSKALSRLPLARAKDVWRGKVEEGRSRVSVRTRLRVALCADRPAFMLAFIKVDRPCLV